MTNGELKEVTLSSRAATSCAWTCGGRRRAAGVYGVMQWWWYDMMHLI